MTGVPRINGDLGEEFKKILKKCGGLGTRLLGFADLFKRFDTWKKG